MEYALVKGHHFYFLFRHNDMLCSSLRIGRDAYYEFPKDERMVFLEENLTEEHYLTAKDIMHKCLCQCRALIEEAERYDREPRVGDVVVIDGFLHKILGAQGKVWVTEWIEVEENTFTRLSTTTCVRKGIGCIDRKVYDKILKLYDMAYNTVQSLLENREEKNQDGDKRR